MPYAISELKNDLTAILHGTNLSKVTNVTELINRSARDVLLDVDPQETIRKEQITNAIYDRVYDYPLPSDVKGNKIIDLRPQVNRGVNDNFSQTYSENFDLEKLNNDFTIEFDQGNKFLRVSKSLTTPVTLHAFESIDGNGTWAVGSDASNLTLDRQTRVAGGASLNFDLDGGPANSGYIENSTMGELDLSIHEDVGSLFLYVYFPDASIITSVNLRWGDSATSYWNRTVTTAHPSNGFQNGWNLLRFDWNGATETGLLPADSSVIDYSRITINYDGTAETDIRTDSLTVHLGEIYDVAYYSKFLFRDSSGTWIEDHTADDDNVNLDTESYNLLLYKIAELAAQQIQAEDATFDISYFAQKYALMLNRYKAQYKSQVEKPLQRYYSMP